MGLALKNDSKRRRYQLAPNRKEWELALLFVRAFRSLDSIVGEDLAARPWRVVEAQHIAATMKIVDDVSEQGLLESLLERSKPPTSC